MFYLGIDVAKVNHVASLIGEDGSILVKAIKFTNSNEGLQKLIDSISAYDKSQIYCAMEATGDYWLSLFSALTDKDFNVSVFNPYQIKSFRGAYSNRKQKNDVIDSVIIADFLRFNGIDQKLKASLIKFSLSTQMFFLILLVMLLNKFYLIAQLQMKLQILILESLLIFLKKLQRVDTEQILFAK